MDTEMESVKQNVLVRYLLGELPEEEQIRLEDRAFDDQDLTAQIQAVEDDLIDEYVRGELPERQRRPFESRFLASAARRRKVEFARALERLVAATPGVEQTATLRRWQVPWWLRTPSVLRSPAPALRFAIAAALLLLLGAFWLVTERARLGTQVTQLRADLETLQRQGEDLRGEAAAERARSADLEGQLEIERRRLAEVMSRAGDRLRRDTAGASALVALFLPPGLGRGTAGLPRLVLPKPTEPQVRLEIGLEPEDDYESFEVGLHTLAGREVWTQDGLRARESPAGPIIALDIPADLLEAGEYELRLTGLITTGHSEAVRYYYFVTLKT